MQLKRAKFLEYFFNRVPCLIGMEACGGAQHWARHLRAMGHTVKLLPARQVRPFAGGNKSDQADARAIWTAVQQPGIKAVAIKTEAQQAVLALHRMRQQLVKFRTAQINALRGLLTEYGEVMPRGRAALRKGVVEAFARIAERLPAVLVDTLREQFARIDRLDDEIAEIERRLTDWFKQDAACRCVAAVPGVGMLTATAVVATTLRERCKSCARACLGFGASPGLGAERNVQFAAHRIGVAAQGRNGWCVLSATRARFQPRHAGLSHAHACSHVGLRHARCLACAEQFVQGCKLIGQRLISCRITGPLHPSLVRRFHVEGYGLVTFSNHVFTCFSRARVVSSSCDGVCSVFLMNACRITMCWPIVVQ